MSTVPYGGVHDEENRLPTIIIDAEELIRECLASVNEHDGLDSLFPSVGWLCGKLSDGRIPLIFGFDLIPHVSDDNLKAFCAAFGTTGTSVSSFWFALENVSLFSNVEVYHIIATIPYGKYNTRGDRRGCNSKVVVFLSG